MARRVERTTGLPRPRPKERRDSARTFAGITWTDRRRDLTILGVAVAFFASPSMSATTSMSITAIVLSP